MALLALDIGTRMGYVLGTQARNISGTRDFSPRRHEGGGMRFLQFRRWLNEMHAADPITEVVYEEVRRHIGTDAAHIYGGFLSQLTAWCEDNTIPYEGVPVGTIKKAATGKGNADKAMMIAAAVAAGFDPVDDNHADAIALFRLRLSTNNETSAAPPAEAAARGP